MFYDDHWKELNDINKRSRASKSVYDQAPASISSNLQKQITEDYADMIKILKNFKRFKTFLEYVKIRIRFFDDSDDDNVIEFGYPHTLKNTICLPTNYYTELNREKKVKLLLHESIHIYQRNFPFEFNKFLTEEFNLTVINLNKNLHLKSRYNPDINDLVYADDGLYKIMIYNNENPKNLADSNLLEKRISRKTRESSYENIIYHFKHAGVQEEHPYEVFASVISEYMYSNYCSCILCNKLEKWLN